MIPRNERVALAAVNGFAYCLGVCGLVAFQVAYYFSAMTAPASDRLARAVQKWTESPWPAIVLWANWLWWAGCFYLTAKLVAYPRSANQSTFRRVRAATLLASAVILLALAYCVLFV